MSKPRPTLEEAYEFEMDQRMIDANDPTGYGSDTVFANEREAAADKVKRDGPKVKRPKDVTIIREDVEWGDLGHG